MKIFTGRVISTKMPKTATVLVERVVPHPVYKKPVKRAKKYQVHDEAGIAKVGQIVRFKDSKPYSKLKKWDLVGTAKKERTTKTEKDKVTEAVKAATKEKKPAVKKTKKTVKSK